jgi:hypothetical protein
VKVSAGFPACGQFLARRGKCQAQVRCLRLVVSILSHFLFDAWQSMAPRGQKKNCDARAPWQPVGLKTHNADFRENDILALRVNMLIRKNLHSIHGLSKMLISQNLDILAITS